MSELKEVQDRIYFLSLMLDALCDSTKGLAAACAAYQEAIAKIRDIEVKMPDLEGLDMQEQTEKLILLEQVLDRHRAKFGSIKTEVLKAELRVKKECHKSLRLAEETDVFAAADIVRSDELVAGKAGLYNPKHGTCLNFGPRFDTRGVAESLSKYGYEVTEPTRGVVDVVAVKVQQHDLTKPPKTKFQKDVDKVIEIMAKLPHAKILGNPDEQAMQVTVAYSGTDVNSLVTMLNEAGVECHDVSSSPAPSPMDGGGVATVLKLRSPEPAEATSAS